MNTAYEAGAITAPLRSALAASGQPVAAVAQAIGADQAALQGFLDGHDAAIDFAIGTKLATHLGMVLRFNLCLQGANSHVPTNDDTHPEADQCYTLHIVPDLTGVFRDQLRFAREAGNTMEQIARAADVPACLLDALVSDGTASIPLSVADALAPHLGLSLVAASAGTDGTDGPHRRPWVAWKLCVGLSAPSILKWQVLAS
jgi:hypothetical protein